MSNTLALADAGIETALTDRLGCELPEFAAFVLLETAEGRAALTEYYRPFAQLAAAQHMPLVLDTPTWRANPDWASLLGFDAASLDRLNAAAAALTRDVATEFAPESDVTIAGVVGPRYDDDGATTMTADAAADYHATQVRALAEAGVDRITAVTMTDQWEAEGVVRAARSAGIAVVVSFSVGAEGRLPSGLTLAEAIDAVETATDGYPAGYMINCAHPAEAALALSLRGESEDAHERQSQLLAERVLGFRLNAARHGDEGAGDDPLADAAAPTPRTSQRSPSCSHAEPITR
jgi:homocysteine S-methyltransferase